MADADAERLRNVLHAATEGARCMLWGCGLALPGGLSPALMDHRLGDAIRVAARDAVVWAGHGLTGPVPLVAVLLHVAGEEIEARWARDADLGVWGPTPKYIKAKIHDFEHVLGRTTDRDRHLILSLRSSAEERGRARLLTPAEWREASRLLYSRIRTGAPSQ